nr:carboxypeptidase B-like isoform X2 [Procambarus clarkii]
MMTALCRALLRTYAFILITFILPSSLLQTVNEPHPGTSTCFSFANTTSSKEDEVIRPLLHTAGVQQHDGETKNYSGWRLLQVFVPAGDEVAGLLEALEASGQVVVLGTLMERSRVVVEVAVGPHVSLEHLLSTSRNTSRPPPRLQHGRHHNKHRHSVIDEGSVEGAEAGAVRGATQEGGRERRALLEGVLGWKTLLEDIGESVFASSRRHLTGHEHLAWDNYYRYSSIATFARGLAQQHRTVECLEVGRTFEGRPLLALIIATNARQMARDYHRKVLGVRRHNARDRLNARQPQTTHNNGPKEERRDERAHAREWTSPAVATYLAQQLADAGKMFLKHVSFIIVPAMNPDGYEFSITTDRLWRKNRRPIDASCVGVDLNRNWDTVWDLGAGASDLSCSYIYRGERAFSEIETRSLADLAKTFRKSLTMFVSLHSFGEFVLYPWGYTMDRSDMSTYLRYLAKRITRLLNKNGTAHFRYGQSSRMMYLASGTSDDYMHSLGVPFAYTIELPRDDFILPPQDIIPLAEDLWNTLVCTAGHLVGSRDAQNLCKKRIVRTYGKGNKTLKGWVHKKVPLAQAEEMVRRQHTAKRD